MDVMTISMIAGMVILGAGAFFFAWKFGKEKKNTTAVIGLAAIGPLVNVIKDMLPDKEGIDAPEILEAVAGIVSGASKAIADPANVTFDDCKDDLAAVVQEELTKLGVTMSNPALIDTAVSAVFLLIKNYPTIVEQLKKVKAGVSNATG